MPVATTSIVTLAEAKVFTGMSSLPAADEALVEALIDAASLDFEAHWDNWGVQRADAQKITYREIEAHRSRDTIWLRRFPIISVSGISDPAGNVIDSDDYWIDADVGALRAVDSWDAPLDSNGYESYWTVTYTAGRVATTAAVPANIKLACKMWVAELYKNPSQNVKGKTVGDLSITYKDGSGASLPDPIRRLIACWKKVDA